MFLDWISQISAFYKLIYPSRGRRPGGTHQRGPLDLHLHAVRQLDGHREGAQRVQKLIGWVALDRFSHIFLASSRITTVIHVEAVTRQIIYTTIIHVEAIAK